METLEIKLSKGKMMVSYIALGSLFVLFCVLFYLGWVNKWSLAGTVPVFDNLFIMICLGIAVGGFGFGLVYMLLKANTSLPALIIENDGYTDNIGLLKGHKFMYKDIDRFEDKTVSLNRAIHVYFKDVDAFLNSQSGFKKKMLNATYKQAGTPIAIPARALDYKFEHLLEELNKRLDRSKSM